MNISLSLFPDIDECENSPSVCGAGSTCTNTDGGFTCAYVEGFELFSGTCIGEITKREISKQPKSLEETLKYLWATICSNLLGLFITCNLVHRNCIWSFTYFAQTPMNVRQTMEAAFPIPDVLCLILRDFKQNSVDKISKKKFMNFEKLKL